MKKFTCGHCGGRIAVNPRHLGTLVVCPECGKPTHPLAGDILAASKNGPPVRALSAEPVERRCENCGRTIGRLEAVQVWNNHLVCDDCHPRLARTLPGGNGKSAGGAGGGAGGGMKTLPAPTKPVEGSAGAGTAGVPADAALAVSLAKPAGKLPVKRASRPRKGRGAAGSGAAALPAPVAAEGGVTALPSPSPSTPMAGSNVPTLVMDRPSAGGGGTRAVGGPGWDSGVGGGNRSDPLASAGAAAMSAVAAVSAVAPIAVKVARVWPWRRPPAPAGRPPEGQFRNRLIGLSLLAVVAGLAIYAAITLLMAVAGFITKVAFGLLAFGGIVVALWVAAVAIRRYVPWPPFGRKAGTGGERAVVGGNANGNLARRE